MLIHLLEVHEVVRIIVQDQEVVLASYPIDLLSPFQRKNDTGGIRSGGIYVHYFRHFLSRQLSVSQRFPQNIWNQTVLILGDRDQLYVMRRDLKSKNDFPRIYFANL